MEINGEAGSPVFKVYSDWANGYCGLCKKKLEVIDFHKTGSGAEHILRCGHKLTVISLKDEAENLKMGSSYSSIGIEQSGKLDIHVEMSGSEVSKEVQEISVTKLFCHYMYPKFDSFRNDEQDSPIDVIAEARSGADKEYFQVTKLNDSDFWKKLNTNKKVDVVMFEIENLVKNAIERKALFDKHIKQKIILLIDARPGVIPSVGKEIKDNLSDLLENSGFKEIWLAGSTLEITYRLI